MPITLRLVTTRVRKKTNLKFKSTFINQLNKIMNVFFKKIVPAFFAIAALTSCSSDDLLGNSDGLSISNDGDLAVTVEQLEDEAAGVTRAAFIKTGNKLQWQKDVDSISVYNSSLFVYDWYAFDGKSFRIDELGPYVDEAAYALFPKSSVKTTSWNRVTGEVNAFINIPAQLTYSEDNLTVKDSVIYVSNIPMWGTAENDGEKGKVKTTMYYTTGILKVTLKNAFSNMGTVDALLIRGWKDLNAEKAIVAGEAEGAAGTFAKGDVSTWGDMPLAGEFLATLDKETPQNTQLVATNTTVNSPLLFVDLSNMEDTTTVVYIPVPADTYGHLVVCAGKATRDAKGDITDFASVEVLKHYSNKTIARAKIYAGTNKEYAKGTAIQNTGNTPELVNGLLKNFASNKGDVKITDDGVAGLTVTKDDDEVIEIPNMTCDTLFLAPTDIKAAGGATKLTIKDADGAAYTGAVVVEVPKTAVDIDIQLKNAKVHLRGHFNTDGADDFTNAKDVTVAGASGGKSTLTVGNGAVKTYVKTVSPDAYVGDITIAALANVQDVTIKSVYAVTKNIKIQGNVTGTVTALAADTEVSGAGTVATLTTSGNVTINASKELEVIKTALNMNESKKLTLSAGYVKALNVATEKTITFANTEAKPTAIGTVTLTGTAKINDYTSTWCGTIPDVTVGKPAEDYKDAQTIYTATQLALMKTNGNVTLKANIDLNDKAWKPITYTGTVFDGNKKTIRNLKISAKPGTKDVNATNFGFFASITPAADDATVKNLTFNNVTIACENNGTGLPSQIGVLAGSVSTATNAYIIENVNVTGDNNTITSTSGKKVEQIGGLVGLTAGTKALTIKGTDKKHYGVVNMKSIAGAYYMGGLIGYVTNTATVTISHYTPSVGAFSNSISSIFDPDDTDVKLGTIGTVIGSINAATTITIGAAAADEKITPADVIKNNRTSLGYKNHFIVSGTTLYRFVGPKNTVAAGMVGFSADFTDLVINGNHYQDAVSKLSAAISAANEIYLDGNTEGTKLDGSSAAKAFILNNYVKSNVWAE